MDFSFYFFSANDNYQAAERYQFILDCARFADQHGFKAIWTPERHFQEFGGSFPNPAVLSAAIAMVTSKLHLRAGSVVSPLHHPIRIVEEWSLVDQLSKGRVGLCLATGWHKADFLFNPPGYEDRRNITYSSVDIIRDLWQGDKLGFYGVDEQVVEVNTYPRPYQKVLPLWLVHTSNPGIWVKAGEIGANVLTLLDNYERLEDNISNYRHALKTNGHDPSKGIVTVGMHTFIGDDEDHVRHLVKTPIKAYLATFLKQRMHDNKLEGESKMLKANEQEQLLELAFEDMFSQRALLGGFEKCSKIVQKLKAIGVNEIASLVDFGLPFEKVKQAMPALSAFKKQIELNESL